jgi:hypothetical protein
MLLLKSVKFRLGILFFYSIIVCVCCPGEQFHGGGWVEFDDIGNKSLDALTCSSFVLFLSWIDLM